MNKIKWIFFDIGYTLVNEDDIWNNRIKETIEIAKNEGKELTHEEIYNAVLDAASKYQTQARTAAKNLGISKFADYCPEYEVLYPNVELVLSELKKNYKLGVIANQCEDLYGRLDKLHIAKYFDLIVSSHDVKLEKPDKRIFYLALEQANCLAEEAVMIGDRLDNDVAPANELGFKTIRIKQGIGRVQEPLNNFAIPTYTIYSVEELLRIFK